MIFDQSTVLAGSIVILLFCFHDALVIILLIICSRDIYKKEIKKS